MPFLLLLLFIPILLIVVFALLAGAVGLFFGLLKFILPVVLIAALINLFVRDDHHRTSQSRAQAHQQRQQYRQSYRDARAGRKEIHDVKEDDVVNHYHQFNQDTQTKNNNEQNHHDDNDNDEWSDF
ncbi:hypothetical protein [Lapidilactobacillus bayanensis]|uniref:hypothetical protein n=1 Tax=Lapidilactobacillus bayanensis TaxID=2485998 RepID=UPI000F78AB17|nr:hypothetical protein [Lapidilactobacillus bayanensis]